METQSVSFPEEGQHLPSPLKPSLTPNPHSVTMPKFRAAVPRGQTSRKRNLCSRLGFVSKVKAPMIAQQVAQRFWRINREEAKFVG